MKKLTTNNIENIKVNDIIAFQNYTTNAKGVIVQVDYKDKESGKVYSTSQEQNLFTNGNGYARINGNKTSICRELLRLGGFSIFIFDSLSELYAFLDSTKTPIENLEIESLATDSRFFFTIVTPNGQSVSSNDTYKRRRDATRGAKRFIKSFEKVILEEN